MKKIVIFFICAVGQQQLSAQPLGSLVEEVTEENAARNKAAKEVFVRPAQGSAATVEGVNTQKFLEGLGPRKLPSIDTNRPANVTIPSPTPSPRTPVETPIERVSPVTPENAPLGRSVSEPLVKLLPGAPLGKAKITTVPSPLGPRQPQPLPPSSTPLLPAPSDLPNYYFEQGGFHETFKSPAAGLGHAGESPASPLGTSETPHGYQRKQGRWESGLIRKTNMGHGISELQGSTHVEHKPLAPITKPVRVQHEPPAQPLK